MPLTTAQFERRRLALTLAAQTSRGDDCETDIKARAETFLAFLEGGSDTVEPTWGPNIALTDDDLRSIIDAIGRRLARGGH